MGKAARKRAASTDSGGSASSSEASSSKRDGSKRPRQAEPESVQGTIALSLDASAAGPSETTASGAPSLKILNFNANGILKAFERSGKRLDKLLREEDPDIVVFTETRYDPQEPRKGKHEGMAPLQAFLKRYKYTTFGVNPGASGSAGVSVHSKLAPLAVTKGLPTATDPKSTRGRYIAYEFPSFHLVAVYVPNSGNSAKTAVHKDRIAWDAALRQHVRTLDASKPVILVGDMNVAPEDRDVHASSGKLKMKQIPGCILPHERKGWEQLLAPIQATEETLVDVWRHKHPDETKVFTHVGNGDKLNIHSGYRLDHFVVPHRLIDQVERCEILSAKTGLSDHIPIVMSIRLRVP